MASNPSEQEKLLFPGNLNEDCNLPIDSSFHFVKPSLDGAHQPCSLDVFPVLLEEASFPTREKCAYLSSHEQDVYSIAVLPEESNAIPQCTSELALLSFLRVPFPSKEAMWLDAELNCQNCIDLEMQRADTYSPCVVDINIDDQNLETLKSNDKPVGSTKSEGVVTKVLQKQSSINLSGKFMQLPLNHGTSPTFSSSCRDNSVIERVHDAPINRWRRYKRAASFDSRKVVLLFSILSSFGTLVLIYLTLRVRQTADGFVHT